MSTDHLPHDPRLADLPRDVQTWLKETYRPDGICVWLNAYDRGDEAKRSQMIQHARLDPMGT